MSITVENSSTIMKEIQERLYDIPFDNSQFQNENFIINSSMTRERAYRNAGLRLQDRLIALDSTRFKLRRDEIKIKQLKKKLEVETDELEKELIMIDIEEIENALPYTNKLINDSIVEANQLYNFIQSCPRYTREEFESAERVHFEKKLEQDILGITGSIKALADMGVDISRLQEGKIEYKTEPKGLL